MHVLVGSFRYSKHMHVLMHLVCPYCGSLLPSTVNNALALVNIIWVHIVWMHPKYPSEARECCRPPSKYCLCRTATPFSWCPCALGLVQWAMSHPAWFHHASTFFICHIYTAVWSLYGYTANMTWMVILYSQGNPCESLRLHLVGCCQYDVIILTMLLLLRYRST